MPVAKVFLDSNILIYLKDDSEPQKQQIVSNWVGSLRAAWITPLLSRQVLREYYAAVTRKTKIGRNRADARQDVILFERWLCPDPNDQMLGAWRIEDAYGFNFYDCLILASALNAGATHVLTEDMQHNQVVGGVRIVNPFIASFKDLGVS